MRNTLFKNLFILFLFFIAYFTPTISKAVDINDVTSAIVASEYQCHISGVNCVVDRVKYIQTGQVFYDAECSTTSHMLKSTYETNVINDVQSDFYNYCSPTSRALKFAN